MPIVAGGTSFMYNLTIGAPGRTVEKRTVRPPVDPAGLGITDPLPGDPLSGDPLPSDVVLANAVPANVGASGPGPAERALMVFRFR